MALVDRLARACVLIDPTVRWRARELSCFVAVSWWRRLLTSQPVDQQNIYESVL